MTLTTLPYIGRWDSAYFLGIAEHGYRASGPLHWHAFFPLYPFCISRLATFLTPGTTGPAASTLVISGLLISNLAFIWATLALYRLCFKKFSK